MRLPNLTASSLTVMKIIFQLIEDTLTAILERFKPCFEIHSLPGRVQVASVAPFEFHPSDSMDAPQAKCPGDDYLPAYS